MRHRMKSKVQDADDHANANPHHESPDRQIPYKFKAHLDSFTYTANSPVSSSVRQPQLQTKSSIMAGSKRGRNTPAVKVEDKAPLRRSSRKRSSDDEDNDFTASAAPAKKKKKTTTKQRSAADPHNPVNRLVDSLRPDLTLVLIGLNPGLMTAEKGDSLSPVLATLLT